MEYESDEIVVLRQEHKIMTKQIAEFQKIVGSFRVAAKRSKQRRQLCNLRGNICQMHQHIRSQKQRIHELEEMLLVVDPARLGWYAPWIRQRLERRQKNILTKIARNRKTPFV